MKTLILLLIFPLIAQADDLDKMFQREYIYLMSQKNSYSNQQTLMKTRHQNRIKTLELELSKMEKEYAKLTVANEVAYQEVQKLENFARDEENEANYLKRIYKSASESLAELNQELQFSAQKTPLPPVNDPTVLNFETLSKNIIKSLYDSSQKEEIEGVYRNLKGDLVEGKIQRFGKAAVTTQTTDGQKLLGPSPEGILRELEGKKFSPNDLYLFEKLTEKAEAKKLPDWVDHLATIAPIFILSLMFFAVCGLFFALIKE